MYIIQLSHIWHQIVTNDRAELNGRLNEKVLLYTLYIYYN